MSATTTEPRTGQTAPELARAAGVNPLDYLEARGYVQDVSDPAGLRAAFDAGQVTVYYGCDATATSLHIGNLIGIMVLASLQRFGHRPIPLVGGGTSMVGDPSGKTATRSVPSLEEIQTNVAKIQTQFDRHIDFEGGRFGGNPPALLVNNADWLLELRYIEFLRDIGRHFSVNEMLAVETYKNRLETTGLNFVEFNYRIVQAYDFLHLYRKLGSTVQIGGSDQWANIVAGVDLIRRADAGKAHALVWPIIETSSGAKMGKSEGNAIWIDQTRMSPYDYFQYWVNTEDPDVGRFLRMFTFLPEEQIANLTSVEGAALREAKSTLAWEATKLTHGEEAANEARDASQALFSDRRSVALDDPTLPTTEISAADVAGGLTTAELFVRAGLCTSRGEARRLASQGGLSINDVRIEDVDQPFAPAGEASLLRVGKKRYRRVVVR